MRTHIAIKASVIFVAALAPMKTSSNTALAAPAPMASAAPKNISDGTIPGTSGSTISITKSNDKVQYTSTNGVVTILLKGGDHVTIEVADGDKVNVIMTGKRNKLQYHGNGGVVADADGGSMNDSNTEVTVGKTNGSGDDNTVDVHGSNIDVLVNSDNNMLNVHPGANNNQGSEGPNANENTWGGNGGSGNTVTGDNGSTYGWGT